MRGGAARRERRRDDDDDEGGTTTTTMAREPRGNGAREGDGEDDGAATRGGAEGVGNRWRAGTRINRWWTRGRGRRG